MERRKFLFSAGLSMASVAMLRGQSIASILQDPTYKMRPLRNNIGIFTEQGGTIAYLVNKGGIVVVDAQFPTTAPHLIAELKKQSDKPFQWLINTHHHGDHTSGNIAFKGIAQNVAAHTNSVVNQKIATAGKEDTQLYPNINFEDGWNIKVGDESIKAHYFGPGHTNGDAMIHFENANIVHTGDLVFNRRYPVVDPKAGASVRHWAVALHSAQRKFNKDTQFVFGHAFDPEKVVGTMDDLKAMQNYMERLVAYVGDQIKAGKTKEEVLRTTSIPGITDWQGQGIQRGLGAAYDELHAG